MYIYQFIKSIAMLRDPSVVKPFVGFNNDILYCGIIKKSHLPKEIKRFYTDGKKFMLYYECTDLTKLKAICIDSIDNYIKILNDEEIDLSSLNENQISSSIYEALWFLEELICWEPNPIADIHQSLNALLAIFQKNDVDSQPVLSLFDVPINVDLFLAKTRFFVKKYLKVKFSLRTKTIMDEFAFNRCLEEGLCYYLSHTPDGWKVGEITNVPNQEFDGFIQQLALKSETKRGIEE